MGQPLLPHGTVRRTLGRHLPSWPRRRLRRGEEPPTIAEMALELLHRWYPGHHVPRSSLQLALFELERSGVLERTSEGQLRPSSIWQHAASRRGKGTNGREGEASAGKLEQLRSIDRDQRWREAEERRQREQQHERAMLRMELDHRLSRWRALRKEGENQLEVGRGGHWPANHAPSTQAPGEPGAAEGQAPSQPGRREERIPR